MDYSNKAVIRSTAGCFHRTIAATVLIIVSVSQSAWAAAPASLVTKVTYDAGNNVTSVTDPRGLVTTQATDGLGQRWKLVSPDAGTTNFVYDAYGRLASMTRANGAQTTYGYDSLNRQTRVSAGGVSQTFVYDTCSNGLGRLCSDGDSKGATSYSYTPEGWLGGKGFSVVVPGGSPVSYALGYNYDFEGRISTITYPDKNEVIYHRTQGAVSSVSYVIGGTTTVGVSAITYRPMEMGMTSWTASNGLTNTLSYDQDGRLTGISVPGTQNLGFAYDAANRVHQITNSIDTALSQTFTYDAQSQLNSVTSGADNESYTYDADGNRSTASVNGVTQTYGVSATSNQLLSFSSSSSTHYGYDAMGNTTIVNGSTAYQYDPFNRLTSSGGATDYIDPEGQRLSKTGGSTGSNYFAPDQANAMMAENQGGGWTDYVWLNGRLVGRIANGQAYAIHADQVGRPEFVTDANKTVVWHAKNFPFTQTVSVANIPLNLGFPGQYYDTETGTWNNGYRDYNSGFGRYLESDPVGLGGGINTYAYVGNNPSSRVDPYGMFWMPGDTLPQGFVDGVAGFGDALSFGLTGWARHGLGIGSVDECSGLYHGGQAAGIVAGLLDGEGEAEIAGALLTSDGTIRTTETVANQLANSRSYIPMQSILDAVAGGTRTADAQGVAGAYMYTAEASFNGSIGTLEVLVNEETKTIMHVLFRSGK